MDVLSHFALGYLNSDCEFYKNGNSCLKNIKRHGVVRNYDEIFGKEKNCEPVNLVNCCVLGCSQIFESTKSYEDHYNAIHRYCCSICHKNLPSSHLLDLHFQETHDSFFVVQAEKKPMFSCFIEECNHKSKNKKERKTHCIEIHNFPHDFRFDQVLESTKSSNQNMEVQNLEKGLEKNTEYNLVHKQNTFYFGHNSRKTFNRKTPSILTQDYMLDDMMENLPQY